MLKLLRVLKEYKAGVLLVMVLLLSQTLCELMLPQLTAKIVDVGIEQGGIEGPVMEQMRSETRNGIRLFMTAEEKSLLDASYAQQADGTYALLEEADTGALSAAMLEPVDMVYFLTSEDAEEGSYASMLGLSGRTLEEVTAAFEAGEETEESLLALRTSSMEKLGEAGSSVREQLSVQQVRREYQALGLDLYQVQQSYLRATGLRMILMAALMLCLALLVGVVASRISAGVSRTLRSRVYSKVMSFSSREIDQFSTASLITRSTNDIQQIQMVITMILRIVLSAPLMAIGGIYMVASSRSGLSWIIVVAVALLLTLIFSLMSIVQPKFKLMQKLLDRLNGVSREILTGIFVIRAFTREDYEVRRFDQANKDVMNNQLFTSRVLLLMTPGMTIIMNGVSLAIVWFGSHRVDAGLMQVGDMMAFINYAMMIIMSFLMISIISMMLPRAIVASERVNEVLDSQTLIFDPEQPKDVSEDQVKGVLSFENVSFRYPNADADVLEGISFTAEPGKTTAIIGSTGCGKSTLLNLIPRLYDVTGGRITLDGTDIRDLTQKFLRDQIGYVPQKAVLFSGDIRKNLKFADSEISDEQMAEAARIAQAEEFISGLNDGYDHEIAQGGSNVSGGQKQRLAIARAIAKDPKIYLFDDSFSALDYKTDRALRSALEKKTVDSTVIIVAQRIGTILHADRILVLDEGRIVGDGTHSELLATCPEYQEIAESQLSAEEIEATKKQYSSAAGKAAEAAGTNAVGAEEKDAVPDDKNGKGGDR